MNEIVVAIAIILFPGLIAVVICDAITVHRPRWGSFKYVVYSYIFGVGCYMIVWVLQQTLQWCGCTDDSFTLIPWLTSDMAGLSSAKLGDVFTAVLSAFITSPIVAFLAAWIANSKLINRWAQKLKVSNKYGDENLFSYFLNADETGWVYIRDQGSGFTYEGRIESFSEGDNIQEIVLSEVRVFSYLSSEHLYDVPKIYISHEPGRFVIESIPENQIGGN